MSRAGFGGKISNIKFSRALQSLFEGKEQRSFLWSVVHRRVDETFIHTVGIFGEPVSPRHSSRH
jgi:hypothetical protein